MLTLKTFNPPYKEQTMNNCTIHVLRNAICNRYKKQTGKELNLDVIELGRKISKVMWGNENLINSIGGNLGIILKTASHIELTDDKNIELHITNVRDIKLDKKAIYDELSNGNAICWSGIGSLTKLQDKNIFEKKSSSGSHAMLLDTIDTENKIIEFQNSINLMERVECTYEHFFENSMNCWSFDLEIKKQSNKVTERLTLEKWKSKNEDQSRGNSCTIFSFENNLSIQLNRLTGTRDFNLNEYKLNEQVEKFYNLPIGYIDKHGFNPERILECFTEISIADTGIKILAWENLYLGDLEMFVHGVLNSIWSGKPAMVGCKGHSFKNENGDWEWEYNPNKRVSYHEMNIDTYEVKNGTPYLVLENSYKSKPRMYVKLKNCLNCITNALVFELDISSSRIDMLKLNDKKREISFEQVAKILK